MPYNDEPSKQLDHDYADVEFQLGDALLEISRLQALSWALETLREVYNALKSGTLMVSSHEDADDMATTAFVVSPTTRGETVRSTSGYQPLTFSLSVQAEPSRPPHVLELDASLASPLHARADVQIAGAPSVALATNLLYDSLTRLVHAIESAPRITGEPSVPTDQ